MTSSSSSRPPSCGRRRGSPSAGLVLDLPGDLAQLAVIDPYPPAFRAAIQRDAEDVFELRMLLEAIVAERAAEHALPEQLAGLRQLAEAQFKEATDRRAGYLERIADLNSKFHQALQDTAASERLKVMLANLTEAPLVLQTFRDYRHEDLMRSAHHHLEIVQALEAGDGSWAATVMRSHVLSARRVFRRERVNYLTGVPTGC